MHNIARTLKIKGGGNYYTVVRSKKVYIGRQNSEASGDIGWCRQARN